MGRRVNQHEDIVHVLSLLEQATALLDAIGLSEFAVHTDHAGQLLKQNILMTRLIDTAPVIRSTNLKRKLI